MVVLWEGGVLMSEIPLYSPDGGGKWHLGPAQGQGGGSSEGGGLSREGGEGRGVFQVRLGGREGGGGHLSDYRGSTSLISHGKI